MFCCFGTPRYVLSRTPCFLVVRGELFVFSQNWGLHGEFWGVHLDVAGQNVESVSCTRPEGLEPGISVISRCFGGLHSKRVQPPLVLQGQDIFCLHLSVSDACRLCVGAHNAWRGEKSSR